MSILDKSFQYTPSHKTDVRKTFTRQLAVNFDGDETVAEFDQQLKKMGLKVVGQQVRNDGMPQLIVEFVGYDIVAAEMMTAKLAKAYGLDRIKK